MVNERLLCNPSRRFLEEFSPSTLSTSNVSDESEWGSRRRLHAFMIMAACVAHEAIMKDQVEHNRSRSNGNGYRLISREEPESAR